LKIALSMTAPSGDPVTTITEAEATGEVADLYADIRATLGVPVVNLIWRHLATMPGALPWAREALKPLYANGTVAAQANALRNGLDVPNLTGLSAPTLAAAGLSQGDLTQIVMIQNSYERSNALNIIALGALLARLEGTAATPGDPAPIVAEVTPVAGKMPPLLGLNDMPSEVAQLVQDLNRIGDRDEIMASMYRHLSHWPPYLALIHTLIAPFAADGRLEPVIQDVIKEGRRRAAEITNGLATPATMPTAAVQADMITALSQFIDGPIGKMIAVVPLIGRALPANS
jgi:hypothetical protein